MRIADSQILECLEQWRFFVFDRATADQDWPGALGTQRPAETLDNRRRIRQADVEFQIPCHLHALFLRPD